jgi:DnaK suppressor protein
MTPAELTDEQLATLRAQLLAAREALVSAPRPATTVADAEVGDAMDVADRVAHSDAAGARNERDAGRLADIDHALAKFSTNDYGVSEDSGEPIGFGRLKAIPWARLTVAEEEALEKRK